MASKGDGAPHCKEVEKAIITDTLVKQLGNIKICW